MAFGGLQALCQFVQQFHLYGPVDVASLFGVGTALRFVRTRVAIGLGRLVDHRGFVVVQFASPQRLSRGTAHGVRVGLVLEGAGDKLFTDIFGLSILCPVFGNKTANAVFFQVGQLLAIVVARISPPAD